MENYKILHHLKSIENVADVVNEKQRQSVIYDSLRQKTREALRALSKEKTEQGWFCMSNQFFLLPNDVMVKSMQNDINTFSNEIDRLRVETKKDINHLYELEGKEPLKGYDLKPMSSSDFNISDQLPHRRYNPLLDQWIIVSPQRINRPWLGQESAVSDHFRTDPDAKNYLQPGATRSNGTINPNYEQTHLFQNDFPALIDYEEIDSDVVEDPLFMKQPASGRCDVMCFHRKTNMSLACMQLSEIYNVYKVWVEISKSTLSKGTFKWIQIFENHGEIVGCSNPHPHCQIWATKFIPTIPGKMCSNMKKYLSKYGNRLLQDYVIREGTDSPRIVCMNDDWVIFVPWWAQWPFETLLLPRNRFDLLYLHQLNDAELNSLADITKELLCRYDNLFKCDFSYCFTWYQARLDESTDENKYWTLHAVWYPPLLRSATVKKFVAGYELFGELQRDLTPEQAAKVLREQSKSHYLLES